MHLKQFSEKMPAIFLGPQCVNADGLSSYINNTVISDSEHHNLDLTVYIFDYEGHSNSTVGML